MNDSRANRPEERVLVLAPTGKDAALARSVLERAGLDCLCCSGLEQLCAELEAGMGAVLLPEEAVAMEASDGLTRWIARQPPWSDLPVLVLARPGADSPAVAQAMERLGNVTVLERPLRVAALVSAIRTAVRARRRQYEAREQLVQIERSEQELRDFFENASVGLHWVDSRGIILRVNQTELDMLGYASDEYVGRHVSEFHADPRVIEDILCRLAKGESLTDQEARLRCRDGSIKDVLIDSSVLWEAGRFVHTRCFTRDITDRKRAENALKEANRRKDEFLAILAHELRNPLAPIRNSLHILHTTTRNDPTTVRLSEMMERQINHMVQLVDDLMEVARITRDKIVLRKERIDVAAVVRSAVETSQPLIDAARHRLILVIPHEPLVLEGDSVRLSQIFSNILNNAAKYTDQGGRISLTVRREENMAVVSVLDTGMGISAEMLPRVFDLFTQSDRTPGRAQSGLGIGLTLVKRFVEMHGGSIEAHSDGPDTGSEFVVRLPLAIDSLAEEPTREREKPGATGPPPRVLVVDDNHDAAESLGMLLKLLGSDVQVVYNGPDALEALDVYQPSVVLLDIGMPGMDGNEVARRIRQKPRCRDTVLIALTGWGQEDDRRRSEEAGFNYHLIKPADLGALETLLLSIGNRV